MLRPANEIFRVAAFALIVANSASAQMDGALPPGSSPADAYIAALGLDSVLAARLREQLRQTQGQERLLTAEALGRVYVRALARAKEPEERKRIESRCKELMESVPEAETYELRIELARTVYLSIENNAENARMFLTTPEQNEEALRVLRSVAPQFQAMTRKLAGDVDRLSRRLENPGAADPDQIRQRLEDARSWRSRAAYYAGWSLYYQALLESNTRAAAEAMESFGVILNAAPGRPASVDRMSRQFLRFPHYARAAVGCAMCASLLGQHVEATRWLDAVEDAEELPEDIRQQIVVRRVTLLSASGRWADLAALVNRHRSRDESQTKRLSKGEARLLAVVALSASSAGSPLQRTRELTAELAQVALADLVAMGEIQHVQDLFRRFGTAPIAERGFIAAYLRSLDIYEQAQKEHVAKDDQARESATDPATITRYREAAGLLKLAIESSDASAYPAELSKALVRRGLALFRAGDFEAAADQLEQAFANAADAEDRREALWYAIVALDRAIEAGKVSLRARCDQLASMLVRQYPGSERAVALLPRLVGSSQISGDDAIKSLLEIPSESPLYLTARSEAIRYLYAKFKQAPPADREFLALQVADLGDQVIRMYGKVAMSGLDQDARDAAERLNVRARQVVDVILAAPSPDPARAESILELIDSVAAFHAVPLDKLRPELEYYRFQIALARSDLGQADVHYGKIQELAPGNPDAARFRALCENARFTRAVQSWSAAREDVPLARDVVRHGEVIIARESDHSAPWFAAVLDRTSAAAFVVWRAAAEEPMRDLVIRIDGMLFSSTRTAAGLRRMAFALESVGRTAEALDLWREILGGVDEGSNEWYEALTESIRLLSESDPKAAGDLLRQHEVLHPDPAPEPWRTRLQELKVQLKDRIDPSKTNPAGTGAPR